MKIQESEVGIMLLKATGGHVHFTVARVISFAVLSACHEPANNIVMVV
jgi:hypothetical protein